MQIDIKKIFTLTFFSTMLALVAGPGWAQAIAEAPYLDESDPQIAYNEKDSEFLVIYRDPTGNIVGQIRDAYWSTVDDYVLLLSSGVTASFDHARVTYTYKPHTDARYFITALYTETSGPLPLKQLVVYAFDKSGNLEWGRTVRSTPNVAYNPDIVADNFEAYDCCLLVAWEEGVGQLKTQVITASGTLQGSPNQINTGEAFHPSVAYQRSNDSFLVTYQRKTGPASELVAQRISINNAPYPAQIVASLAENPITAYGERYTTASEVAHNFTSNLSTVVWYDNEKYKARHLDRYASGSGPEMILFDGFLDVLDAIPGTPSVVAVPGSADMVAAYPTSYTRFIPPAPTTTTYHLSSKRISGMVLDFLSGFGSSPGVVFGGRLGFSDLSGYYVGVWEENELAGASGGNSDVYGREHALP